MSRKDFSQQFPSPQQVPEDIFPQEDEVYHTLPEDIFPVFQPENEPMNTPPVVEHQNNPFGLTEDELRLLEQDEEVRRETEERELREEAARMEQEARDAEHLRKNWFDIMEAKYYNGEFRESSSEEGYNSDFSL